MSPGSEEVLAKALSLPPNERAALAEKLFSSLDLAAEQKIEELWAKEAESRIDAYERGEIESIPAEKVFKKIDSRRKL